MEQNNQNGYSARFLGRVTRRAKRKSVGGARWERRAVSGATGPAVSRLVSGPMKSRFYYQIKNGSGGNNVRALLCKELCISLLCICICIRKQVGVSGIKDDRRCQLPQPASRHLSRKQQPLRHPSQKIMHNQSISRTFFLLVYHTTVGHIGLLDSGILSLPAPQLSFPGSPGIYPMSCFLPSHFLSS